jgi:hypothetical protein
MASFLEMKLASLRSELADLPSKYKPDFDEIDYQISWWEDQYNQIRFDIENNDSLANPVSLYMLEQELTECERNIFAHHQELMELTYRQDEERYDLKQEIILVDHQVKMATVLAELKYKKDHWARRRAAVIAWHRLRVARRTRAEERRRVVVEEVW